MEFKLIEKLNEYISLNKPVALVTIIDNVGSSPRKTGSMMLIDKDGNLVTGTIGGGKIEQTAKTDAKECIEKSISKTFNYKLTEEKDALGMACGGSVSFFVKTFHIKDKLIIVGAGHICEKLVYFANAFNYEITIIDNREEFANKDRYPSVDHLLCGDIVEILKEQSIDENTSIVIITHGHLHDRASLKAVVSENYRYLGMIGSRAKLKSCFDTLVDEGISSKELKKVHSPIGLNIGGETPEEIALSIIAEIQSVKYNLDGRSIKLTKGQI